MGERSHPTLGQLATSAKAEATRFNLVVDSFRAGTITDPTMLMVAGARFKSAVWAAVSHAELAAKEARNNV